MIWRIGLTDDPARRKLDLGNPPDWQDVEFDSVEVAHAWRTKYLEQSGYVEDAIGTGWRYGYWYSTNLIQCPDCRKLISPSAVACPGCGRPVDGPVEKDDTGKTKCSHQYEVPVETGRIIERKEKKANPVLKGLSAIGFLFTCLYYLVAIALCATIVGAIIGIPMFIGAAAFQTALLSVMMDGTKYKIECPICRRTIENVFKPKKEIEKALKCPSCKSRIIVRDNEVLSFR